MNIPAIRFILEELKRLEIPVNNFYIVVNGRKTCQSVEFLHLLIDMYMYQDYKDEYLPMIQMSNDKYHSHPDEQRESNGPCGRPAQRGIRTDEREAARSGQILLPRRGV